ncbi:MAG TPA: hypothetical protein VFQ74_01145 [Pseudolysinimonas sp.]|nr:hypothetical protein [Pseudolysinimonas sp.]
MSEVITKAMKRPGIAPAFLTGLGVFATLLVTGVVQAILSILWAATAGSSPSGYLGQVWSQHLQESLSGRLPFAIGVFLCFWQLAPIAPVLRLAHVVTRSILAALVGGTVMWLVLMALQLVAAVVRTPFSTPAFTVLGELGPDALQALFQTLSAIVAWLPVAVLGGILLWGWLQRHPLDKPVHGALDEV